MTAPATAAPETKAAGPDYSDGIMVALLVPEEQARTLAVADGLPPEDLHITLAYLGSVGEIDNQPATLSTLLDVVTAVTAQHPQITGKLGGIGRFSLDGDQDAFYLSYDSPALDWLRTHLVAALDDAELPVSMGHGFTPHVTLAYLAPSDPGPLQRAQPVELTFPELHVVWGETRVAFEFGVDADADVTIRPEEIADPRTWSELRQAQDAAKSFFEESAHPRGPGGKFAAKPEQGGAGGVLPPDWLDRLLAGDASFVKPAGGKGKGKGKGKKPKAKKAPRSRRAKSTSAAVRQARNDRARRARARRDRETLAELSKRNSFDEAMSREQDTEDDRRSAADARIEAEADPKKQSAMRAEEADRKRGWAAKQAKLRRDETTRRRRWELNRRAQQAADAAAEAQLRDEEQAAKDAAAAEDEAANAAADTAAEAAAAKEKG